MGKERKIYIIISYSKSMPARVINFYTREVYAHASVSLNKNLEPIYAFGRKKVNNPLYGGFVIEKIGEGIYKKFYDTICLVIEVDVTEESYEKLKKEIEFFILQKEKYRYNFLGVFAAIFNKKLYRDKHFYCTEFVRTVLERADIDMRGVPKVCHAKDFLKTPNSKVIYDGLLNKYSENK